MAFVEPFLGWPAGAAWMVGNGKTWYLCTKAPHPGKPRHMHAVGTRPPAPAPSLGIGPVSITLRHTSPLSCTPTKPRLPRRDLCLRRSYHDLVVPSSFPPALKLAPRPVCLPQAALVRIPFRVYLVFPRWVTDVLRSKACSLRPATLFCVPISQVDRRCNLVPCPLSGRRTYIDRSC